MDKNGVDGGKVRIVVKVGLKLLMQLVGGLAAAVLAAGNKVLSKDGAVAVNNDKSKGR